MWSGRAGPLVVGHDLDRLALEFLEPIEMGLLSTGWIQSGQVRLAGRDLDGLALEFLETIKIGGHAIQRRATHRLETTEMGWLSAHWIPFGRASSLLAGHGQDNLILASLRLSGWADSWSIQYDVDGPTLVNWIWFGWADFCPAGDDLDDPDIPILGLSLASWMRSAHARSQRAGSDLDRLALGWLYRLALGCLDVIWMGKLCPGSRLLGLNGNWLRAGWTSCVWGFSILFHRRG